METRKKSSRSKIKNRENAADNTDIGQKTKEKKKRPCKKENKKIVGENDCEKGSQEEEPNEEESLADLRKEYATDDGEYDEYSANPISGENGIARMSEYRFNPAEYYSDQYSAKAGLSKLVRNAFTRNTGAIDMRLNKVQDREKDIVNDNGNGAKDNGKDIVNDTRAKDKAKDNNGTDIVSDGEKNYGGAFVDSQQEANEPAQDKNIQDLSSTCNCSVRLRYDLLQQMLREKRDLSFIRAIIELL